MEPETAPWGNAFQTDSLPPAAQQTSGAGERAGRAPPPPSLKRAESAGQRRPGGKLQPRGRGAGSRVQPRPRAARPWGSGPLPAGSHTRGAAAPERGHAHGRPCTDTRGCAHAHCHSRTPVVSPPHQVRAAAAFSRPLSAATGGSAPAPCQDPPGTVPASPRLPEGPRSGAVPVRCSPGPNAVARPWRGVRRCRRSCSAPRRYGRSHARPGAPRRWERRDRAAAAAGKGEGAAAPTRPVPSGLSLPSRRYYGALPVREERIPRPLPASRRHRAPFALRESRAALTELGSLVPSRAALSRAVLNCAEPCSVGPRCSALCCAMGQPCRAVPCCSVPCSVGLRCVM